MSANNEFPKQDYKVWLKSVLITLHYISPIKLPAPRNPGRTGETTPIEANLKFIFRPLTGEILTIGSTDIIQVNGSWISEHQIRGERELPRPSPPLMIYRLALIFNSAALPHANSIHLSAPSVRDRLSGERLVCLSRARESSTAAPPPLTLRWFCLSRASRVDGSGDERDKSQPGLFGTGFPPVLKTD